MANTDNYDYAHDLTAQWEGGVSADKNDNGNKYKISGTTYYTKTYYGVTFKTWLGWKGKSKPTTKAEFDALNAEFNKTTKADAKALFKKEIWDKNNLGDIKDKKVAATIYDAMINQNYTLGGTGNKTLKRVLKKLGITGYDISTQEKAIAVLNKAVEDKGAEEVLNSYAEVRENSYIQSSKKGENHSFGKGWMNRLNDHRTENKVDTTLTTINDNPLEGDTGITNIVRQKVEIIEEEEEGDDVEVPLRRKTYDKEFESWDDVDPEKIGEDEVFTVEGKVYKKDPAMGIYRRYDEENGEFDANEAGDENSQWINDLKIVKERKAENDRKAEIERQKNLDEEVYEEVNPDVPYQRDGKLYQMIDGVEVEIQPGIDPIHEAKKTDGQIGEEDRPNLVEPLSEETPVKIGPENEEVLKKPRLKDYKTSSDYMKARREYYKKLKEQGKDNEKGENQAEPPKKKRKITPSAQKKLDKAVADGVITQEEADSLKGTGLFKTVNNRDVKNLLAKKERQANKVDMTKVEGSSTYEDPNKKVDERTDEQKVTDAVNAPPRILTPEEIEENKKKGPQVAKLEKKPKVHTASIGQPILDLIKSIHKKIKKLSEDTTIPFSEKQSQMSALQSQLDNTGYTGDLNANGEPEGQGRYVHASGSIEEGEFKDGKLVNGTYTLESGATFTGEFDEDGDLRKGVKKLQHGYTEEGEFDEDGWLLTKGKITYANGSTYEGVLKDGAANGGVYTDANGVVTENYYQGANVPTCESGHPNCPGPPSQAHADLLAADENTSVAGQDADNNGIDDSVDRLNPEHPSYVPPTTGARTEVSREVNSNGTTTVTYDDGSTETLPQSIDPNRLPTERPEDRVNRIDNVREGQENGEYEKNLNGQWVHTDPNSGETTIIEDQQTIDLLETEYTTEVLTHPTTGETQTVYRDVEEEVVEETVVTEEKGPVVEAGNEAKSDFINTARSALDTANNVAGGLINAGSQVLDAIGGPGAIVSYLMGKESLKDAMKEVTPKQKANLSASFMEHLRQTKELQKRGFHPTEARAVQKEIDTAYQVGLEASVRGTAGDRAKYLAQSGILDAKRSSALLDYSVKDAELQRTNQTKYTAMLNFKENFDAQRSEALRTEDMENQKAKQEAASKFTGQMFENVMGGLSGNSLGSFFQQNSTAITSFMDKLK